MRITVLTDRFTPEVTAVSTRTHAHAKAWAAAGHDVTVVTCAPNFPRGVLFDGYRNRFQSEEMDGFRVVRLWSYLAPNEGTIRRTIDYTSFTLSSILQSGRLPKADVTLATSPPIFVAVAGHFVARRQRTPWVFEVRDLWPAQIRGAGMDKGAVLDLVERVELGLYRSAKRVMVVTEPFKRDLVSRGVPADKIDVVLNGNEPIDVDPACIRATRARFGIDDNALVVGFVGTIGLSQGAGVLVRAADRLRGVGSLVFLIVGEGAGRAELESIVRERNLTNVKFHNFVPRTEVDALIASLDIATVVLKNDPTFETVIPSKLFELFAAKRPIVAAVAGEARRVIEDAGCGICVPPEDDEAFAAALRQLAHDPQRRAAMGERGDAIVREKYSRTANARLALDCLTRAAAL